jgi:nucleoside-diphosphate-sugar epimerase
MRSCDKRVLFRVEVAVKFLITGGAGYVGSVLTAHALSLGHSVRAVDILWFQETVPLNYYYSPRYEFVRGDVCDVGFMEKQLADVDFVVHTAAVVGDPASKKYPDLTKRINYDATIALIELCKTHPVRGFLFLSTCSNYGISDGMATEDGVLKPLSLYAETKVDVEKYLMTRVTKPDWFIGRLSTVYGISPRIRFDLTVNDFSAAAFFEKKIDIFLPQSFRPYINVSDLSRVLLKVIENFEKVKNQVFNVGFPGENYQKIKIADAVKKYLPSTDIGILKEGGDKRDYQVDFSKLHTALAIQNEHTVDSSVRDLIYVFGQGVIRNYRDSKYYNTSPNL